MPTVEKALAPSWQKETWSSSKTRAPYDYVAKK